MGGEVIQNLANKITCAETVLSGDLNTLLLSVRTLFLEVVLAIKTLLRPLQTKTFHEFE